RSRCVRKLRPVGTAEAADGEARRISEGRPMPTVLIVEDGEVAAEALARLIRRAGFQADRAATGEAALAYLRQLTPDLVVCDLMMPHMDGLGVLRAVRADPRTADLPVLVYSAAGDAARETALDAGA